MGSGHSEVSARWSLVPTLNMSGSGRTTYGLPTNTRPPHLPRHPVTGRVSSSVLHHVPVALPRHRGTVIVRGSQTGRGWTSRAAALTDAVDDHARSTKNTPAGLLLLGHTLVIERGTVLGAESGEHGSAAAQQLRARSE
jgi:hypothetical protein